MIAPHPQSGRASLLLVLAAACLTLAGAVWWYWTPVDHSPSRAASRLFVDILPESGVDFVHENGARGERLLPETTTGAAGWIDYDRDGLYDLYLVDASVESGGAGEGGYGNRLYRNLGGGRFTDVTAAAGVGDRGYGGGLAVGDYDNDGLSDLYVTNYGVNVLYHNEGDGTFRNVTGEAGVAGGDWSTSAAFLDYDADGYLDLYVCRYVDYDPTLKCKYGGVSTYCSPKEFPGLPDLLYRNRGDGTFEDVSAAAGIAIAGPRDGKSLGVIALDHDDDGDTDIYVACDQVRNLLFRNNGDGTFKEVGLLASVAYSDEGASQAGMGVDAGDIDLDGRAELVVTNFSDERNALYRNEGAGYFDDAGVAFGLGGPSLVPLGFGILLIDHDLDSDLDLFVANGHVQDNVSALRPGRTFAQPDQLFENEAGRRLVEVSATAGLLQLPPGVGRAAASADFDNDGDEDIVVMNSGSRPVLLRNEGPTGHWIAFFLRGTKSNRDGYGARVTVSARRGDRLFTRVLECRSARSYAAACDPRVRVGLGARAVTVVTVEIRWPSGVVQELSRPALDRTHEVVEPEGEG